MLLFLILVFCYVYPHNVIYPLIHKLYLISHFFKLPSECLGFYYQFLWWWIGWTCEFILNLTNQRRGRFLLAILLLISSQWLFFNVVSNFTKLYLFSQLSVAWFSSISRYLQLIFCRNYFTSCMFTVIMFNSIALIYA